MFNNCLFLIQQPPGIPTSIPLAALKVELTFEKSSAFKNASDVNRCKHVCGFPYRRTFGQEAKAWRNVMKSKMELARMPGWKQSTAAQWAAIQAYAITRRHVRQTLGLWQANNLHGECFTECLDLLPKDIAKKHQHILTDMLKVHPVATVGVVDPAPAGNNRKLALSVGLNVPFMLIELVLASPVRTRCVS